MHENFNFIANNPNIYLEIYLDKTLRVWIRGLDKSLNATGTGSGRALCAVVVGYDVEVLISGNDVVVLVSTFSVVEFANVRSSTVVLPGVSMEVNIRY